MDSVTYRFCQQYVDDSEMTTVRAIKSRSAFCHLGYLCYFVYLNSIFSFPSHTSLIHCCYFAVMLLKVLTWPAMDVVLILLLLLLLFCYFVLNWHCMELVMLSVCQWVSFTTPSYHTWSVAWVWLGATPPVLVGLYERHVASSPVPPAALRSNTLAAGPVLRPGCVEP